MKIAGKWKLLFIPAIIIGVAAIGFKQFQQPIAEMVMSRMAQKNAGRDMAAKLPDGLHIFICGAGSPMPDPLRAGPCTGIIAGSHVFVFDAGAGSIGNLLRMGFPIGRVDAVYLTHLHSDHLDGLGELLLQSWINGSRKSPLSVRGPKGVEEVVQGFNTAYRIDSTYRLAHHGPEIADLAGYGAVPEVLQADRQGAVVFKAANLTIKAVPVKHHPADPAFGYRIDYKDRSVTISGDTVYHEALVALAKSTDLLLHDALNVEMVEVVRSALQDKGLRHLDKILLDIQDYHASPRDAARAARDAGAQMLVLHHIVPPLPSRQLYSLFLKGTDQVLDKPIVVAEDGMIISLPAGETGMEQIDGFGS